MTIVRWIVSMPLFSPKTESQVIDGFKSQADLSWDQGADLCCEEVPDATTLPAAKDALRPGTLIAIRFGDRFLGGFLGLILNGVILLFVIIVSIYVTIRNRKPWWAGFNKVEGEWRL